MYFFIFILSTDCYSLSSLVSKDVFLSLLSTGRSGNNYIGLTMPAHNSVGYLPPPRRLFPPAFVCLPVHLSVCQEHHIKTTDRVFKKISDKEFTIKFSKSSRFGSGSRNFLKEFCHCEIGEIQYVLLITQKVTDKFLWWFFEGWDFALDFGAYPDHDPI